MFLGCLCFLVPSSVFEVSLVEREVSPGWQHLHLLNLRCKLLTLYLICLSLNSHYVGGVCPSSVLTEHRESYTGTEQQETAADMHYMYLICLHTCSFVPWDFT